MARPTRQGVDYFPLDVHLDDKFKFIQIKYGMEGFAVIIKLLQNIYANGYWYDWGEDEELIFAHENNIDLKLLQDIINESVKREVFNGEMYTDYKILTSKGIQKIYKEIVKRRINVEIVTEYLLIDNNFGVNVDIMNTHSKPNDYKSTQSKVNRKESILKDIKEEDIKPSTPKKTIYGEFKKVKLLDEEHNKLIERLGASNTKNLIEKLDLYKESTGKVYKSDYATILNWSKKEAINGGDRTRTNNTNAKTKEQGEDIAKRANVISL